MRRCSSICQQDLCLPEDNRGKFGSFVFDCTLMMMHLELRKYFDLETVAEEFHGNAEKYHINFYG